MNIFEIFSRGEDMDLHIPWLEWMLWLLKIWVKRGPFLSRNDLKEKAEVTRVLSIAKEGTCRKSGIYHNPVMNFLICYNKEL